MEVTPRGPLVVERFAPEGEVPLAATVSVTFSEPMVPVGATEALPDEAVPVEISPRPAGSWRWMGTRTLVFQPAKRLPMATRFTVRIPAGTKAMSGKSLAEEVRWSFTTPAPTLVNVLPWGRGVELEPLILLVFNQEITPGEMLGSVEVWAEGAEVIARLATRAEVEADEVIRRATEAAGACLPVVRLRLDAEDALADGDALGAGLGAVGGALGEGRDGGEVAAELFLGHGEGRPLQLLLGVFEGEDQARGLLTCQSAEVGGVARAELGGKGDDGGAIVEGGEGAEGLGTSVEDVSLQDGDAAGGACHERTARLGGRFEVMLPEEGLRRDLG